MMRGFVIGLVVMALATTVFGQAQSFSFREPPSAWDAALVGTGPAPVSDLVIDVNTDVPWDADPSDGFSVTIDVFLTAGQNGMKAAGIFLNNDQGVTYDGATDWLDSGFAIQEYGDSAAPPFGAPANSQGWSTAPADAEQWAAGALDADGLPNPPDLDGGTANEMGTIASDLVAGATDGFFGAITLNIPAVGEAFPIMIQTGGYMGDLEGTAYQDLSFGTIQIVPEPASLVLLLGALPLLRRRR